MHIYILIAYSLLYALNLCRWSSCHLFLEELSQMFFCNRLVELSKNILLRWLDTGTPLQSKGLERGKEVVEYINVCSVSVAETYFPNNLCIVKSRISGNHCCFLTMFYV